MYFLKCIISKKDISSATLMLRGTLCLKRLRNYYEKRQCIWNVYCQPSKWINKGNTRVGVSSIVKTWFHTQHGHWTLYIRLKPYDHKENWDYCIICKEKVICEPHTANVTTNTTKNKEFNCTILCIVNIWGGVYEIVELVQWIKEH
jgi:hypothetical protein